MPTSLGSILQNSLARGVENAITKNLRAYLTPGLAEKAGMAVGAWILLRGYQANRAHDQAQRLKRVEEKVDRLLAQQNP